jgi:hypothetical protein
LQGYWRLLRSYVRVSFPFVSDGRVCRFRALTFLRIAETILANQPDFLEQKCSIAEIIEDAGHLCLFLPKYHCELNIIEFFWGATKRYTRGKSPLLPPLYIYILIFSVSQKTVIIACLVSRPTFRSAKRPSRSRRCGVGTTA